MNKIARGFLSRIHLTMEEFRGRASLHRKGRRNGPREKKRVRATAYGRGKRIPSAMQHDKSQPRPCSTFESVIMSFHSPVRHLLRPQKKTGPSQARRLPFFVHSVPDLTTTPRWSETITLQAGLLASGSLYSPRLPGDSISPVACCGFRSRLQRRAHS